MLLLLMLPGLLLPAGASLQVCLCAWHGVPANAGCRAEATAETAPATGCPHCRARRPDAGDAGTVPGEQQQRLTQRAPCHCVVVDVPDDALQVAPEAPQHASPAPLAAPLPAVAALPLAVAAPRHWPPAHDRPPPGHQRNLPLRL
jgi:hypothetical protein